MANKDEIAVAQKQNLNAGATAPPSDFENLTSLVGRLGEDVMTLVDTKISLLKIEVKEDVSAYARNGALTLAGALVALLGFLLLNVAVAFFVSKIFTFADERLNYACGFLLTGVFYLVVGGIIVLVMKNKLAAQNPMPEQSIEEIKRDKQWLKKEI